MSDEMHSKTGGRPHRRRPVGGFGKFLAFGLAVEQEEERLWKIRERERERKLLANITFGIQCAVPAIATWFYRGDFWQFPVLQQLGWMSLWLLLTSALCTGNVLAFMAREVLVDWVSWCVVVPILVVWEIFGRAWPVLLLPIGALIGSLLHPETLAQLAADPNWLELCATGRTVYAAVFTPRYIGDWALSIPSKVQWVLTWLNTPFQVLVDGVALIGWEMEYLLICLCAAQLVYMYMNSTTPKWLQHVDLAAMWVLAFHFLAHCVAFSICFITS